MVVLEFSSSVNIPGSVETGESLSLTKKDATKKVATHKRCNTQNGHKIVECTLFRPTPFLIGKCQNSKKTSFASSVARCALCEKAPISLVK